MLRKGGKCHAMLMVVWKKSYLIKDCNNPIFGTTIRFGIRFGIHFGIQ
jgi:hypothetical protein